MNGVFRSLYFIFLIDLKYDYNIMLNVKMYNFFKELKFIVIFFCYI